MLNKKFEPDEPTLKKILYCTLKVYDSIPDIDELDTISQTHLTKIDSITAVISGLIVRNWDWLVEQDQHINCKNIILSISRLPLPPEPSPDIMIERLFSRSVARCLPHLLLRFPDDKKILKLILNSSVDYHDEIRAFIFENLKIHWTKNEDVIWKSIDNLLKELKINRKNFKSLKPEQDIRTKNLMSLIMIIPTELDVDKIKTKSKLLKLITTLLEFTINAFLTHERDDRYNKWSANPWNFGFFWRLVDVLLFSSGKYDDELLRPLMEKWEKTPSVMESFLSQLALMRPQPHLEDRFVRIWQKIAGEVIESDYCKITSNYYLRDTKRDIISYLIFVTPSLSLSNESSKILFIPKITEYIGYWCEKFATHKECYVMLLKFLKYYGFELLSEYGIKWIYHVFTKTENIDQFLKETKVTNYLSEILWDFWHSEHNNLKKEYQKFEYLTYVVDRLSNTGDKLALNLQQKINST